MKWAEYVGKVLGWELGGQEKRSRSLVGRTPFEILAKACECAASNRNYQAVEESPDVRLWREYERVTKGRRQLVWSHGLRQAAGLAQAQTDEELLALGDGLLAPEEEVVYSFQPLEWQALWRQPGRLEAVLEFAGQPIPILECRQGIAFLVSGWVASAGP
jgi:hypothetical protein